MLASRRILSPSNFSRLGALRLISSSVGGPSSLSSSPSSRKDDVYDVFRIYPSPIVDVKPPTCVARGEVTVRELLVPRAGSSDIHVRDVLSLSIQSRSQQQSSRPSGLSSFQSRDAKGASLILPRGDALLVKLGHVTAVIWRDEALLFDSGRHDVQKLASEIDEALLMLHACERNSGGAAAAAAATATTASAEDAHQHSERNSGGASAAVATASADDVHQHFELMFLEAVLRDICDSWHRRLRLYGPVVRGLLSQGGLDADAEADFMHQLVPLKDGLEQFGMEVDAARTTVTDLLKSDADMLALLLTERHLRGGQPLDPKLHDVVELLLEDYSRQLHAIHQEIEYLLRRVQSKQEAVSLSMDSYRNRLIHMNVHLAVASVCLSVGSCTAGFLGMNVPNGFESNPMAFGFALAGSGAAAAGVITACRSYLHGGTMRRRVDERAKRVRAVSRVLADMGSLEYAIRCVIDKEEQAEDQAISREELKALIEKGRGGKPVSYGELDIIFSIL